MKLRYLATAAFVAITFLQGCGGGGSDSGTPVLTPAVTSFPLAAGYKALTRSGASDRYLISGSCTGDAVITSAAPVAATFEGVTGYSVSETAAIKFTNCTPTSSTVTSSAYYDSNFGPLGSSTPGVDYTRYTTAPIPLPTSVKVGDTAAVGTLTVYPDSTKASVAGQRVVSFVIEADSTTTAIANAITKGYNASGQLLFTQQSRYRMAADGSLTSLSIDVQYSTISTNHLVYTKT